MNDFFTRTETDIVTVAPNEITGRWNLLLNGYRVGDTRAQPTKEAAIEYARKICKNWHNTKFDFS